MFVFLDFYINNLFNIKMPTGSTPVSINLVY